VADERGHRDPAASVSRRGGIERSSDQKVEQKWSSEHSRSRAAHA